jgi:glycosyltransferase involved in cell wall biosynthesis
VAASPGEPAPGREIRDAVKERLNFLFVTARFWPDLGGAERQLDLLSSFLVRQGHSVTVLCQQREREGAGIRQNGVEVVRLAPRPGGRLRSLAFAAHMMVFLLRRGEDFDVVYANLASSPALVARLWARRLGCPAVLKFGASGSLGDAAVSRSTAVGRWKLGRLKKGFDLYLCPNSEIRREFLELGFPAEKLEVFPNGVDTDYFHPAVGREREVLRRRLRWEGRVVALFSGRFEEQKNLPSLLESWKEAAPRHPGALLILVGEGSQAPLLKRMAGDVDSGDTVRILGRRESGEVREMLQAADFFVLPSLLEGMSNSLLEAMACGLPALASDIPGNRDMIVNGRNGFLVAPNNSSKLTAALDRLLRPPSEFTWMGEEARKTAVEDYAIGKVGDCYLNHIKALLRWK